MNGDLVVAKIAREMLAPGHTCAFSFNWVLSGIRARPRPRPASPADWFPMSQSALPTPGRFDADPVLVARIPRAGWVPGAPRFRVREVARKMPCLESGIPPLSPPDTHFPHITVSPGAEIENVCKWG